jgi:hypothetical protein
VKISQAIKSFDNSDQLKSGFDDIQCLCTGRFMNISTSETPAITFSRKTKSSLLKYKLRVSYFTRTYCIKELMAFINFKLYYHSHVDYILSQLWLILNITFSFSTLKGF